jgi:thiamine kinase-like enzyme
MKSLKAKIVKYFDVLPQGILPVKMVKNLKVKQIKGGDYNLNFKVGFGSRNFLLRLNVEPQSGLKNQMEYEYQTLKFLEPYKIAPKPYYLDSSKKYFPFDLLIEEYLPGRRLPLSLRSLKRFAESLARLHSISLMKGKFLMRWGNPFFDQLKFVSREYYRYKRRKTVNRELIKLGAKIIQKTKKQDKIVKGSLQPASLVHTDLVPSNIIDTGRKVFFIDWEKGRIDDPSYDVAFFLCPLMNLWDWSRMLTEKEKGFFLKIYEKKSGDKTIRQRMNYRMPLIMLHLVLWAGHRLADVKEGLINQALGRQNHRRYMKLLNFRELKKFI